MISRRHRVRGADETGGVLVFVAFWLPVAVLFMSLVIDVGHWFEHKRHLQLQADAAVLAAAGDYRLPCSDDPIVQRAHEYGGELYNPQIGTQPREPTPQNNVHILINSRTYYNQDSLVDDTVNTNPPCTSSMIDVKLTETDVPWFFRAANIPFINAHARVEVRQVDTEAGALPIAVPDVNPKIGRVWLVNETTGATIGTAQTLTKTGTANGLAIWDNSGAPIGVTMPSAGTQIGVRVAFGGGTSTTCGDPLVECYDLSDLNKGILYIRSYTASGTVAAGSPPQARDVRLFYTGSCDDPYFTANATACTVGLKAKVQAAVGTASLKITASVGKTDYPLTFNGGSGYWETSAISVAPNAGGVPITLSWEQTTGTVGGDTCSTRGGNKCKGSFEGGNTVQRVFSATDAQSGPIRVAQVLESGVQWADSFQTGTTHDLVVKLGIKGNLQNAADVNDPAVSLRIVGNRNQTLDCDDGYSNLWQELAFGCRPAYKINTGTACPNQTTLWGSTQPWPCVAIDTGHATNEVPKGLNTRILGDEKAKTCPANVGDLGHNNWSLYPALPTGDPRIVQVFLAPYGSFAGSGSNYTVPVENFATFYVTGWTGQGSGFDNPCQGHGDDPVPNNDPGVIVGHFIKYIQTLNNGGGSQMCDLSAFGSCVAVMTY